MDELKAAINDQVTLANFTLIWKALDDLEKDVISYIYLLGALTL